MKNIEIFHLKICENEDVDLMYVAKKKSQY